MSILIIGSTSLLGQQIAQDFLALGIEYGTLDRKDGFDFSLNYNLDQWQEYIQNYKDIILLSWIGNPSNSKDSLLNGVNINCRAITGLCRAMKKRGYGHLIFTSSAGAVYGDHDEVITEKTTCSPISFYGESKLMAENIIKQELLESIDIKATILRVSNVFGYRKQLTQGFDLINHLIRSVNTKAEFILYGDGLNTRDFIYIKDVSRAIIQVLHKELNQLYSIYNICQGKSYTLLDVISYIEEGMCSKLNTSTMPARACDIKHVRLSSRTAKQDIGWEPIYDLKQGIKEIIHE